MKGSALASLKFSGVPGKFLICALPFSRLCPWVHGWKAGVPVCRHLQGSRFRPQWSVALHKSFGTPLSALGSGMVRRWHQARHSEQGQGKESSPYTNWLKVCVYSQPSTGSRETEPFYSRRSLWEQISPVQGLSASSELDMVPERSAALWRCFWRSGFRFLSGLGLDWDYLLSAAVPEPW